MPTTYSRTMPSLPGTPKTHAERNAQAHVDEIVAAHGLHNLAGASTDIDRADIDVDMVSLIGELSWNAGDGSASLRDAIVERCMETPLSCEAFGRKTCLERILDHHPLRSLAEYRWSSACKLWCDPDDWEVRIYHQDWGTPWQQIHLTDEEIEALQWFVCLLGLDA